MSRNGYSRKRIVVDKETGEELIIETKIKNNDIKGGFVKMLEGSLDKLSADLADTSFRAAYRTYVEMFKRLKMGSNEVTIYPDELMELLGLGEMAVRTHLKILEKRHYITRKSNKKGRHEYILNKLIVSKG